MDYFDDEKNFEFFSSKDCLFGRIVVSLEKIYIYTCLVFLATR